MAIDQSIIQKIIDEADIVQIISEYIKLEKKGADYKGICPFHNDSNPSLSVSPAKKVFKCFSCNVAGNVVKFLEMYKQIPYIEALKMVAKKTGVDLQLDNTTTDKYQKYYDITKEITEFYQFYLYNTVEGEKALAYLHERGLDDQTIKHFQIGLAGSDRYLLTKAFIEKRNFLPLHLRDLDLIKKENNSEKYIDTFTDRIIFPIDNFYGNIAGFSGRIYSKKDSESKYINSSENPVFKKGSLLYNYSRCVSEIKKLDSVFLFEGFMDVIACYRADILNAVANMGTALTKYQISALKKLTNNIIICYDGDNAGIEATKKAIMLFRSYGLYPKAIRIPDQMDPDEYIKKYGPSALKNFLLNQQLNGFDYIYLTEKEKTNLKDPKSADNFKNSVIQYAHDFNSPLILDDAVKKLAEDLNVDASKIDVSKTENNEVLVAPLPEQTKQAQRRKKYRYFIAEKQLIYLSFHSKDDCAYVRDNLPLGLYVDKINRNIMFKLYNYYNLNDEMKKESFLLDLNEDEKNRLENILTDHTILHIEKMNILIEILKEYEYEKNANQLLEKKDSDQFSSDDLQQLIELKKVLIKFKK